MYKLKTIFSALTFFFLCTSNSLAESNLFYIDLDYLLKNSNKGKIMISKLEKTNKIFFDKIEIKKKEIIKLENDFKAKKNILSENEIKNNITILNKKLDEFKIFKNKANKEFEIKKKKELSNLFKEINPIIEDYMNKKSITILMEKKNIFIGKSEYDITNNILELINK